MIKFNINNYIKFKLTQTGEKTVKEYNEETKRMLGKDKILCIKAGKDGYYEMQMWKAIEIFKDDIGISKEESPFKDCEIFFKLDAPIENFKLDVTI